MEHFENLQNKLNELADDFIKFYDKNNKAAGTRIRKGMQELKTIAQDIRKDIQKRKEPTE